MLVAGVVYVYMNQNFHVSRNVRAQWFFKHLHKKLSFLPKDDLVSKKKVLDIFKANFSFKTIIAMYQFMKNILDIINSQLY